jgi:hypothetical protein
VICPDCEANQDQLGEPSLARWIGPDGGEYCSMHFVRRFGHGEKLIKIEGYEPPAKTKAPAPKQAEPKVEKKTEVTA